MSFESHKKSSKKDVTRLRDCEWHSDDERNIQKKAKRIVETVALSSSSFHFHFLADREDWYEICKHSIDLLFKQIFVLVIHLPQETS